MNTLKFGNGEWYGKKDTILAYNDLNSNFKPLPFSFDRDTLATRVNKDGLIETVGSGEPRIDYLNDSKGALLLEPSRSNVITYSEDFNAVGNNWEKVSITIEDSDIISPNGTQNAFKLLRPNDTSSAWIRKRPIVVVGQNQVISMFAKSGSNTVFNITYYDTEDGDRFFNFDLSTKVVSGNGLTNDTYVDSGIKDYGNGWFRCYVIIEAGLTNPQIQFGVGENRVGLPNEYLYVYAPQLEVGSYATSYIPTQGGVVTRNQDSCSQTVPSGVIGQTEGTIYIQLGEINVNASNDIYLELNNGSGSVQRIGIYTDSNNFLRNLIVGGGDSSILQTNYEPQSNDKIAITYKTNEAKIFVNGIQRGGTDTSVGVPTTSRFSLQTNTSNRVQSVQFKEVKLYNTALTNAELINLTTI